MSRGVKEPVASSQPERQPEGAREAREGSLYRLGAVSGLVGLVLVVVMEGFLHPSKAHPNDSLAAFTEYAASAAFTSIHLGDFVGTLLIVVALVALYRSVSHQGGWPLAFATVGVVAALVVAAVFSVQMAVDGIALKATVDDWVSAPSGEKPAAFRVAQGVRDVEKGLSGIFQLTNGVALTGFGLAIALGRVHARWLGWVGVLAGLGALIGGWSTAHTGFSMQAARFSLPTLVLLALFLVGVCASLWRRGAAGRGRAG